jgi:hypothetical protein
VVFAGLHLHRGRDQVLRHAGDKLVVVFDHRLVGDMRRVAFVNRLGGLGCFGGVVILRGEALLAA